MKTVKRGELSNLRMAAGNENKYSIVIVDGRVKEWVGIGWIDLRQATEADRKKYLIATEGK
jgi:hypothetical protein